MPRRDGFGLGHQHGGGGAIVEAGGIGGGHRAVLVESRTQLGHRVDRRAVADVLVGIDGHVALAGLDDARDDLVAEAAGLLRGLRLVLRGDRELGPARRG